MLMTRLDDRSQRTPGTMVWGTTKELSGKGMVVIAIANNEGGVFSQILLLNANLGVLGNGFGDSSQ